MVVHGVNKDRPVPVAVQGVNKDRAGPVVVHGVIRTGPRLWLFSG